VIVAEDDPMMRDLIVGALRGDGFEVLEAASGDALERLASAIACGTLEVSLVVSDIRIPGQSGLAVLPLLRQSARPPPIVLITAFSEPETQRAALNMGATGILDKPFELDDFRTVVWYLARRGAAEQAKGPSVV
jgi:CheY-like chemotaxis protein